jgi:hypothetical protein
MKPMTSTTTMNPLRHTLNTPQSPMPGQTIMSNHPHLSTILTHTPTTTSKMRNLLHTSIATSIIMQRLTPLTTTNPLPPFGATTTKSPLCLSSTMMSQLTATSSMRNPLHTTKLTTTTMSQPRRTSSIPQPLTSGPITANTQLPPYEANDFYYYDEPT